MSNQNSTNRRYTTSELDELERREAERQGMNPEAARAAQESLKTGMREGGYFAGGVEASLKRTILGLKQLLVYFSGSDEARQAINDEIKRMEDQYAEILATPSGKMGEAAGVTGQFMVPGGAGSVVARAAPGATKTLRSLAGAPGTVPRGAVTGGTFEATQPVQPGDVGTDEFLLEKGGRMAAGVGAGAGGAAVAKRLTTPGPTVAPERGSVTKEAKRLGMELTPAQRTGDITLQQYEEGLASRPGSAKVIWDVRQAQQDVLNRKAAEAIGQAAGAPNEAVLANAREVAAAAYKPMAEIPRMGWDADYMIDLDKFIRAQSTKATGSDAAASVAKKLKKANKKWTGSDFLEELQGVRDMAFAARRNGDVATANHLSDLTDIMEDFAERRVAKLAQQGAVPADAMERMKAGRVAYAVLHSVEKATEPVTGRVSALKFLTQEFKRKPASKGPGTSAVDEALREMGAAARVLKQVTPYIGSSGTAERIAGQQLVEASQGPLAAWRAAGPIAKNYLAAKYYMKYGGQPGMLGTTLTPAQSMYVRRLLPGMTVAAGEAMTEE